MLYQALAALLLIKVLLWPAAIVIGDRAVSLRVAWRRMNGIALTSFAALMVLTLPLMAVHVGLTAWAQHGNLAPDAKLWGVLIDGPESLLQLMASLAVTAAVYKLASARADAAA